ncbi:L-fucose:H+ symporter permease [Sunxiuqinia elliptica]|uniref:FHS family L-fucose permease-like MFS transporter n=1 Tax=Sunxiuqinia elliptica TaxID=655355 RepID=A0A4R6GTZ3_9BACT|nr:L-fucose:H+ symporter permease [Sunxiuqinia elliptica]TDN98892.1 FHS family L-fucose permease-like MFS transporter [Sunxiuqinia elliptica]TDO56333.1 FHS family L-fucose permease-like MFS transporter [Sunxiuqinia elliptica]
MKQKDKVIPREYLVPFILITSCFALWGFANDITNPMVEAFSRIFNMGVGGGTWVQVVFYGGYGAMAFPAAFFIKRYTYKAGILVGLGLYATGALLFIPASAIGLYYPFLIAYFVMTCGLSFLETSANPYILFMGPDSTATRRLNFAQAFNPMGSLTGMFVAKNLIQARLDPRGATERMDLSAAEFEKVKMSDLEILSSPYIAIGGVIIVMFLVILFVKMPKNDDSNHKINFIGAVRNLLRVKRYREGVVAQLFYVGAQIMCWTFIVQYGQRIFVEQFGMTPGEGAQKAQYYNIIAMSIFLVSRFVCTFLLKYIQPGRLLMVLALGGIGLAFGTIFLQDINGLYCLVGISACMSLMFPTIYGIALRGMGEDAKFGAAGLIMSIVGGTFLPKLQAFIIDQEVVFNLPAVNVSFVVPLICFLIIAVYGYRTVKFHLNEG